MSNKTATILLVTLAIFTSGCTSEVIQGSEEILVGGTMDDEAFIGSDGEDTLNQSRPMTANEFVTYVDLLNEAVEVREDGELVLSEVDGDILEQVHQVMETTEFDDPALEESKTDLDDIFIP